MKKRKTKKNDVSSSSVRRLAMRGGVKRIQKMILPHLKLYMKLFLEQVYLSLSFFFFLFSSFRLLKTP